MVAQCYSDLGIREAHREAIIHLLCRQLVLSVSLASLSAALISQKSSSTSTGKIFMDLSSDRGRSSMVSYPIRRYVLSTERQCGFHPDLRTLHYVPHLLFYDQRHLTMGTQVHTNSEPRAQCSAMLGPGKDAFDFDGAGFMEVTSHEQFLTACQDPYFHEVILGDELNFLDKTNTLTAMSTMGLNKDFVGRKVVGDTTKSE